MPLALLQNVLGDFILFVESCLKRELVECINATGCSGCGFNVYLIEVSLLTVVLVTVKVERVS